MSVSTVCAIDRPPCAPSTVSQESGPAVTVSGVPLIVTPAVLFVFL